MCACMSLDQYSHISFVFVFLLLEFPIFCLLNLSFQNFVCSLHVSELQVVLSESLLLAVCTFQLYLQFPDSLYEKYMIYFSQKAQFSGF